MPILPGKGLYYLINRVIISRLVGLSLFTATYLLQAPNRSPANLQRGVMWTSKVDDEDPEGPARQKKKRKKKSPSPAPQQTKRKITTISRSDIEHVE